MVTYNFETPSMEGVNGHPINNIMKFDYEIIPFLPTLPYLCQLAFPLLQVLSSLRYESL